MKEIIELENMVKLSKDKHIAADELDVLVSKARELNAIKEQELERLKALLTDLEARLAEFRD